MLRTRAIQLAAATGAAFGLLAVAPSSASAIGYYNVPGSFWQCVGYGNGAGHHACLMLGPLSCRGFCSTHEVRVACPPGPPNSYYGYCANGWNGPMSEGSWIDGPTLPPPSSPEPMPEPAAMRPQILR